MADFDLEKELAVRRRIMEDLRERHIQYEKEHPRDENPAPLLSEFLDLSKAVFKVDFQHVKACAKAGLRSCEHFIRVSTTDLKECVPELTDKELLTMQTMARHFVGFRNLPARELLDELKKLLPAIQTGCAEIDQLLRHNGISCRYITEIVGESASGKTQLCIGLCASALQQFKGTVAYVDASGDIDAKHFLEVIRARAGRSFNTEMIERLRVFRPLCAIGLLDTLERLEKGIRCHESEFGIGLSLVVVDSPLDVLGCLSSKDGRSLRHSISRIMRMLVNEQRVPVVFTNGLVKGSNGELHPALGEAWSHLSDERLLLLRDIARPGRHFVAQQMDKLGMRGDGILFEISARGVSAVHR